MICFSKLGLTRGLVYSAKTRIFNKRPSLFIKDKPILLSARMLHKDYYGKGSVAKKKISGFEPQQDGAKMN
jgi:hypothetical protein